MYYGYMNKHSYAIFLIKQEIKKINNELNQKYFSKDELYIAKAYNPDIANLETTLKLLESDKE